MSSVGENWNVLKNLINVRLRVYMQVPDAIFCLFELKLLLKYKIL